MLLLFVAQYKYVCISRWSIVTGRVVGLVHRFSLMSAKIVGSDVAEVGITDFCGSLGRRAREGREATQVTESRSPRHCENGEGSDGEEERSVLEGGAAVEKVRERGDESLQGAGVFHRW